MENEATVTIPLEEYIELRRKADENLYLATQLGAMDQRMFELCDKTYRYDDRLLRLESELERWRMKKG